MGAQIFNGREAQKYLSMGGPTFRRLVGAGEIPCWEDPHTGRKRYPKLALDTWLAAKATATAKKRRAS